MGQVSKVIQAGVLQKCRAFNYRLQAGFFVYSAITKPTNLKSKICSLPACFAV